MKPKRNDEKKTSIDSINYQCIAQSILIGLLSKHSEIELTKPNKKCLVTQQFIKINSIKFSEDDVIKMNDFIENRCHERKNYEIHSLENDERTATRRIQNYKRIETIHVLIDLLREFQYQFKSKYVEGKKGVLKLETIQSIYKDGKLILNSDDIHSKGLKMNDYLYNIILTSGNHFILNSSNAFVNQLIYGNSS